jgi:hypothetical protein
MISPAIFGTTVTLDHLSGANKESTKGGWRDRSACETREQSDSGRVGRVGRVGREYGVPCSCTLLWRASQTGPFRSLRTVVARQARWRVVGRS